MISSMTRCHPPRVPLRPPSSLGPLSLFSSRFFSARARPQFVIPSRPHQLLPRPSSFLAARSYASPSNSTSTSTNAFSPATMTPSTNNYTLNVPTIDIGPFLADPHSPAANEIVSRVRAACISSGFFQIVNHGVPRALQTAVFDAAAAFFALPFEEKKKLDASSRVGHRGYDVLASQSYEDGVLPDLKEVCF